MQDNTQGTKRKISFFKAFLKLFSVVALIISAVLYLNANVLHAIWWMCLAIFLGVDNIIHYTMNYYLAVKSDELGKFYPGLSSDSQSNKELH